MSKNTLLSNEKRWQRKQLFRKQRMHPAVRLTLLLFIVLAASGIFWKTGVPLSELPLEMDSFLP